MGSEARVNCCCVFESSSEQSHHLYLTIRLDRLAQLPLQSPHLHTRRTHSARDTEQRTGIGHRNGIWMHAMQHCAIHQCIPRLSLLAAVDLRDAA